MSEYIYLKGKGSWVRNNQLNPWNKWSMQLHPDAASMEIVRGLQAEGLKNEVKKDEDGYYLSISRPASLKIRGRESPLLPPMIYDGRKRLPDGSYPPMTELVGNGSDVVVKCEVYSHRKGAGNFEGKAKAMRWYSTRVDNLVPFEKKSDFTDAERDGVEGFQHVEKQLF